MCKFATVVCLFLRKLAGRGHQAVPLGERAFSGVGMPRIGTFASCEGWTGGWLQLALSLWKEFSYGDVCFVGLGCSANLSVQDLVEGKTAAEHVIQVQARHTHDPRPFPPQKGF